MARISEGTPPMPDRLSALDVSFLYLEGRSTPMHVGGVALFSVPAAGVDYQRLCRLITERISAVPRYRQKVRWVPGSVANPVWVDDPQFDIGYHVRRSALPRPGTDAQLRELVARLQSRHLDRSRPLWELYVVEGLADDRFAVVTKTHHAMVDGRSAVDVGQLLLDVTPEVRAVPATQWRPAPEPSSVDLLRDALLDVVRAPSTAIGALRSTAGDAVAFPTKAVRSALGIAVGITAAARTAIRPAAPSPLNAEVRGTRRYAMASTDLDDYRRVRKQHGGTVNDVVLATVAGALRQFLLTRGKPVPCGTTMRALVPVSVRSAEQAGSLGNRVSSYLLDLPVGEVNPVIRLHQVSAAMNAHKESGQSVGADALVALSGFAPPTLHALGARVASGVSRRIFNVVVTNVPGPQFPLYAAGARMLGAYPVVPLAKGQAVSIGLTSYNGGVFYGLLADRDAMPDVDLLASLIEESLAQLVETVG